MEILLIINTMPLPINRDEEFTSQRRINRLDAFITTFRGHVLNKRWNVFRLLWIGRTDSNSYFIGMPVEIVKIIQMMTDRSLFNCNSTNNNGKRKR